MGATCDLCKRVKGYVPHQNKNISPPAIVRCFKRNPIKMISFVFSVFCLLIAHPLLSHAVKWISKCSIKKESMYSLCVSCDDILMLECSIIRSALSELYF
jgi:hypothetical protein